MCQKKERILSDLNVLQRGWADLLELIEGREAEAIDADEVRRRGRELVQQQLDVLSRMGGCDCLKAQG